ncbi:hypothetical protein KR026_005285 [Drosophila bipectinata]|nr:hypothetical protein KR026_005285 [Drosophila bipectinata]
MPKMMCRICSKQGATTNMFLPKNRHLLRQIHSITGVQLSDRNELPSHMCQVCVGDLEGAIKFRQRCIISEKQHLSRLNSSESDNDDPPIKESNEFRKNLYFSESDEPQNECDTVLSSDIDTESCNSEEAQADASFKVPIPVSRAGPYTCDQCGKSINHWTNFQEHRLRHTGIKDFKCQLSGCGKSFATRKELTRHIRRHTGEQPYPCNYCPRRFSDVGAREQHHRRHRNERYYQCDVCEKSFVSSGCLNKHRMTHSSNQIRQH